MTIKEIWKKYSSSICQIVHRQEGKVISSGSGFKIDNYIISNSHVIDTCRSDNVTIQFKDERGIGILLEKNYLKDEFIRLIEVGSPENHWDLAILKDSDFQSIKSIPIADEEEEFEVGQECSILGYPFSSNFLTIHSATISSRHTNSKNDVRYIQLDATVNKGNSGGPLINNENGKLIGIVTRKHTGFSERFSGLSQSFKQNIKHLEENKGIGIQVGNIEILDTFKVIQNQFDSLKTEIERSNNVGIGIAYELTELRELIASIED